jgi:hypothetical protein
MNDYGLFVRQAPDGLSIEEFREWNRSRWHAEGPIVKAGEGHKEIIATNSMRGFIVAEIVGRRHLISRQLMKQREAEIDVGMVHHSPAWVQTFPILDFFKDG